MTTRRVVGGGYYYYILHCKGRTPGFKAVDLSDPSKRELVAQDYLNRRFANWSNEVLESSDTSIR